MADINIERKRRSAWPWLIALLLVLALAAAAWWYLGQRRDTGEPEVLGTNEAPPGATYDPATAPPYPADQGTTRPPAN